MTLIQHTELASAQGEISFSSIPATFDDLLLVISARNTQPRASGGQVGGLKFNGSTANQSLRILEGVGSSVASFTSTANSIWFSTSDDASGTFGSAMVYIPNYLSSANKSFSIEAVSEGNTTTQNQILTAGLWSSSSAITALAFYPTVLGSLAQYSSATLYGIKSGSSGGVVVS